MSVPPEFPNQYKNKANHETLLLRITDSRIKVKLKISSGDPRYILIQKKPTAPSRSLPTSAFSLMAPIHQ
jgi:hypothetical protein